MFSQWCPFPFFVKPDTGLLTWFTLTWFADLTKPKLSAHSIWLHVRLSTPTWGSMVWAVSAGSLWDYISTQALFALPFPGQKAEERNWRVHRELDERQFLPSLRLNSERTLTMTSLCWEWSSECSSESCMCGWNSLSTEHQNADKDSFFYSFMMRVDT